MKELFSALCKAQSQIRGALKENVNPHFKSRYADLESVVEAIREPLASNGLCFVQSVSDGSVQTVICHVSGEQMVSTVPFVGQMPDMQKVGAALTYARRQGLCTAFGVPQVDDDGNEAAAPVKAPPSKKPTPITDAVQKVWENAGFKTEVIECPKFSRDNLETVNAVKSAIAAQKIPNETVKKHKADLEKYLVDNHGKFADFDSAVFDFFSARSAKQ